MFAKVLWVKKTWKSGRLPYGGHLLTGTFFTRTEFGALE